MAHIEQDLLSFFDHELLPAPRFCHKVKRGQAAQGIVHEKPLRQTRIRKASNHYMKANQMEIEAGLVEAHQTPDALSVTKSSRLTDIYDPSQKGDATWDKHGLYTYDGYVICGGLVEPFRYPSIKGIDLVRWFTDTYVRERAEIEASRQKSLKNFSKPPQKLGTGKKQPIGKSVREKKRSNRSRSMFLNLPAEIRNQIYSYIIPHARILIQRNRPGREFNIIKNSWRSESEPIYRTRSRLSHLLDNHDEEHGVTVSPALLFTCSDVKDEIQQFIYARYTFCFDSMKVLRSFLNTASPQGLKAIQKLELHFPGYAQPRLTEYNEFKERYDKRWLQLSQRVAEELPSVQSLKLQIDIHDWPLTMHSDDRWYKIAMHLAQKDRLKDVRVKLTQKMMGADRLARAARRLAEDMMSPEGVRARDEREANLEIQRYYEAKAEARLAEEERRKSLPPTQATKVLSIVVDGCQKSCKSTCEKEEKRYYTSKTKNYARELVYGGYQDLCN